MDNLINDIREILSNQTPPKVVYNKKKKPKTISVKYNFASGTLSILKNVKIIASREDWLKFFYEFDFDKVTFDDFEQYLSRPRKDVKEALKGYAQEWPSSFSSDILDCVEWALSKNPLFRPGRKPRKPSPYELSPHEKNELSAQASYLYIFLKNMCQQPEKIWPAYFKNFCAAYEIIPINLKGNIDRQDAVRKILSIYIDGDPKYFAESFFQTFVTESPVKLSRIKKSKRVSPKSNPFLYPLFKEFLKS